MYFVIFLALFLSLPVIGILPIVKISKYGWANNSLYITIKDPETVDKDTLLCAYAEEVCEWYFKTFVFGMITLVFAVFVAGTDPLLNLAAFMILQILHVFTIIPVVYRVVEYVGKSANIAVLPRDITGSARRLKNYYPQFKGMTEAEIAFGINRAKPVGKFLVSLLWKNINKYKL